MINICQKKLYNFSHKKIEMSFECGVPYSNSLLWSDSWYNSEIVFLNNVDLIQRQWKASMFHGMLHSFMFPSVRCGHLGSVFVKISTFVWYGLFHILNVLHRKQTLNMTGKIKSQHILFRIEFHPYTIWTLCLTWPSYMLFCSTFNPDTIPWCRICIV